MTTRDFERVGELMRLNGTMNGRRIVSAEWIQDTISGGSREAWRKGSGAYGLPDGNYRTNGISWEMRSSRSASTANGST